MTVREVRGETAVMRINGLEYSLYRKVLHDSERLKYRCFVAIWEAIVTKQYNKIFSLYVPYFEHQIFTQKHDLIRPFSKANA